MQATEIVTIETTENIEQVKKADGNWRDNLILLFLIANLLFGFVNYYRQIMTQALLDARAIVQTDTIRLNIKEGRLSPAQIEIYRSNWTASGYNRVAPVEMLDNPDLRK